MPDLSFAINANGQSRYDIAVTGEIDMATAPQLLECLRQHADRDIVVDLTHVPYLDSSGINALVTAYNELREHGHTLRTTNERNSIRKVLEVTGLLPALHDDDT